jgi:hypothetical protein
MIVREVATAAEIITPVRPASGKYVLRVSGDAANEPTALADYNSLKRSCPEFYDLLSTDSTFNKINILSYDSFARMCHHIAGIKLGIFPKTLQYIRHVQLTLPGLGRMDNTFTGVNGLKDLPNLQNLVLHIETMAPTIMIRQANFVRKGAYCCCFSSWQNVDERLDSIAKLRGLQALCVSYDDMIVTDAVKGVSQRTIWALELILCLLLQS